MRNQQQPTSQQTPPDNVPTPAKKAEMPADTTSFYYYARAKKADELQWLESLAQNPIGKINRVQSEENNSVAARQNLLAEEFSGKKLFLPGSGPIETGTKTADSLAALQARQMQVADSLATADSLSKVNMQAKADSLAVADSLFKLQADSIARADSSQLVSTQDSVASQKDSSIVSSRGDSQYVAQDTAQFPKKIVDLIPGNKQIKEYSEQADKLSWQIDQLLAVTDWMLLGTLFSFILTTWAYITFKGLWSRMFRSFYAYGESYKIYRENSLMARRFYLFLDVVFYINLAMFFFQNLEAFNFLPLQLAHSLYFWILLAVVIIGYLLKNVVLRTVGQLFMAKRVSDEYWFSLSTINRVLGVSLFPFLLTIPFAPTWLQSYIIFGGWGLIALAFIFRIIRGMRIAIEKQLSSLYMILYFCTLEILPVLLMYKIIADQVSAGH